MAEVREDFALLMSRLTKPMPSLYPALEAIGVVPVTASNTVP
jgi:hypothetical protein